MEVGAVPSRAPCVPSPSPILPATAGSQVNKEMSILTSSRRAGARDEGRPRLFRGASVPWSVRCWAGRDSPSHHPSPQQGCLLVGHGHLFPGLVKPEAYSGFSLLPLCLERGFYFSLIPWR